MKLYYEEPRIREYQVQIRKGICGVSKVDTDNVDVTDNPFEGSSEEEW